MNQKKYLVLITVVTIICIVCGTFSYVEDNSGLWINNIGEFFGIHEKKNTISVSEDLPDVKAIDIEMNAMEIHIKKGDSFYYIFEGLEKFKPQLDIEDDEISMENHANGIFTNGNISKYCKLVIYVPESIIIQDISINTNYGDLEIDNINCNEIETELDAGAVKIIDSRFNNSEIYTDMGSIKSYNSYLGEAKITCDAGKVELKKLDIDNIEITNDLGATKLELVGEEKDYNFILSDDLGSITVNGKKFKSQYNMKENEKKNVNIKNDMGSIDVKTK